jgi:hypothetical protein
MSKAGRLAGQAAGELRRCDPPGRRAFAGPDLCPRRLPDADRAGPAWLYVADSAMAPALLDRRVQRPSGQHERLSKSERDCRAATCPKSAKPSLRGAVQGLSNGAADRPRMDEAARSPADRHWRPAALQRHAGVRPRRVGRPSQGRGPGPRAKIADAATSTVPGGAGLA